MPIDFVHTLILPITKQHLPRFLAPCASHTQYLKKADNKTTISSQLGADQIIEIRTPVSLPSFWLYNYSSCEGFQPFLFNGPDAVCKCYQLSSVPQPWIKKYEHSGRYNYARDTVVLMYQMLQQI